MANLQPVAVKPPDYKKLLTLLNQSQIQRDNPALWNILEQLLQANLNGQTIINNNITTVAASIPPPASSTAIDNVSLIQQSASWPGANKSDLRVPLRRAAWFVLASNAALTTAAIKQIGLNGLSSSFSTPVQHSGFTWGQDVGAATSVHNVVSSTEFFALGGMQNNQVMVVYYRFFIPSTSALSDTALLMGFYNGTATPNAPQSTAGAGLRYSFQDGTSPTQWVVEAFDGTATRNTSAKFGAVTLNHEYLVKLTYSVNGVGALTLFADVVDVTASTLSSSSVSVPLTGGSSIVTQGCSIGQIAWRNTGATTTRIFQVGSFEWWTGAEL